MGVINTIVEFIAKLLQWWFIVTPWEQGIRVRFGSRVKLVSAGIYFKIPFLDRVYIQTTRLRMANTPMQTVTTRDGHAITLKLSISYLITDVLQLYKSLYHPEMTLDSMALSISSEYLRSKNIIDVDLEELEKLISRKIDVEGYGLGSLTVKVITFAAVRTYRLIQDGSVSYEGLYMEPLK